MPISPNFKQGVEEARPVSPQVCTVAPFLLDLQWLTSHPRSCDRRKLEAQARQWRTPFGAKETQPMYLQPDTLPTTQRGLVHSKIVTQVEFKVLPH